MAMVAWVMAALVFLAAAGSASAQSGIRFQYPQIRITTAVGSNLTTVVTGFPSTNNTIVLANGATNANLTITGLPTGATAFLTDTNSNPLTAITATTPVWMVVNITNVAEGTYAFNLNASGLDTNGLPVSNVMPFVLQVAHIWNGNGLGSVSFGVSNNWSAATSWQGGVPTATDDVVFGDYGAQTNNTASTGIPFNNIGIDTSMTVASLRFAQNSYINTNGTTGSTNSQYHTIKIANGATLAITGTNGFSMLRDYLADSAQGFAISPDNTMQITFLGTNATLSVNNTNANFIVAMGNQELPTLDVSNLGVFVLNVNRAGFSDYQTYPNYINLNTAFNGGHNTNTYQGLPRRMVANVYLAKTNYMTAVYKDPNNYTNEFTRGYAITLQNNEQSCNGSSVNTFFYFGLTNQIYADSICFIGASSASGNTGGAKFNLFKGFTNTAVFRNSDGVSRMSMFALADDGGPNQASSNVKSIVDFTGGNNFVDILADRLIVARDRTLIASNQTPNVQGTLTIGNCKVDVNTVVLGDQEHSNKVDWSSLGAQPYLNYCQGKLILTNSGSSPSIFKVNGTIQLGYTADQNPSSSAQQFNTYGQIQVFSNVTLSANSIVVDGGLNYFDNNGRQNTITIAQGGNVVVTNAIGFNNEGANNFSAADPRGMKLDVLSMSGGTISLTLNPSQVSVFTRTLTTPGIVPGIIKVLALNGVTSFPVQIPAISYEGSASPFLNADVSALGAIYHGYVLNNAGNHTVDVYITTNAPNTLVWTGNLNNNWDTATANWVTSPGGLSTNFNLGDLVTFNDSSTVTNVNISGVVVPGQTGVGVTITNNVNKYTFSGGTIAGTALIAKSGANVLQFDATEQGPINITAGSIISANSSSQLGAVTTSTNVVLNFAGTINGGLNSSGPSFLSGTLNGPVTLPNGYLVNSGTMNVLPNNGSSFILTTSGVMITNTSSGTINLGSGAANQNSFSWDVPVGCVLANLGNINLYVPKLAVEGTFFGNGTLTDQNGGGFASIANANESRVAINGFGVLSPGSSPTNSIDNMNIFARLDFNNDPKAGQGPAGISTVRIEFDFAKSGQKYDTLNVDRWNNDTGWLLLTNLNSAHGTFTLGDTYQVFINSSGQSYNFIDTPGYNPNIMPYVPGPGLQWGLANFSLFGSISVTSSPLVWDGASANNWSTNTTDANWKSGLFYTDNQGAVFNDTATGNGVVNLTTYVAPEGYALTIVTNIVPGVSTNIVTTTNEANFYPGIVVNNTNKNYVFTGPGKITGVTGFYKTGPGSLTLLTSNDFVGNAIVDNGTLVISNYPPLTSIVSLGITGSGQLENELILDNNSTLSYVGQTNATFNTYVVLEPAGGTVNIASPTNLLAVNSKIITGPGALTKTGPGALQLAVTGDVYSGGTVVNAGTVILPVAGLGTGPLTVNNTAGMLITNNITITNPVVVAGPATTFTLIGTTPGTNVFNGLWTGSGTATFTMTNIMTFVSDLSGFSGTLAFGTSSGFLQFNNATNKSPCTGSAAATFNLGTGSEQLDNFNGGGLTYNLGALIGGSNTVVSGRTSNNVAVVSGTTYSIGANGLSTTFAGIITNGLDTVSVVKVGAGTLSLNGTSTYTGSTTVSNGAVGGTGSIASPLTVVAGGSLTPGAPVGTFTVSNNATIGGSIVMSLNSSSPLLNSQLAVTGTLNVSGSTLTVNNVGPDIVNGTTFKLFNKAVSGFSQISLPNLSPTSVPYVWTTNLTVDGSIKLVSGGSPGVNTTPVPIVSTVSGSTLTLSWPADHTGWRLLVQTNSLNVGLNNNWSTVDGSTNVNSVNIQINSTNPTVFYKLTYP